MYFYVCFAWLGWPDEPEWPKYYGMWYCVSVRNETEKKNIFCCCDDAICSMHLFRMWWHWHEFDCIVPFSKKTRWCSIYNICSGISKWSLTRFLCKLHDTFHPILDFIAIRSRTTTPRFIFQTPSLPPTENTGFGGNENCIVWSRSTESHVKLHISCFRNCVVLEYTRDCRPTDKPGNFGVKRKHKTWKYNKNVPRGNIFLEGIASGNSLLLLWRRRPGRKQKNGTYIIYVYMHFVDISITKRKYACILTMILIGIFITSKQQVIPTNLLWKNCSLQMNNAPLHMNASSSSLAYCMWVISIFSKLSFGYVP